MSSALILSSSIEAGLTTSVANFLTAFFSATWSSDNTIGSATCRSRKSYAMVFAPYF